MQFDDDINYKLANSVQNVHSIVPLIEEIDIEKDGSVDMLKYSKDDMGIRAKSIGLENKINISENVYYDISQNKIFIEKNSKMDFNYCSEHIEFDKSGNNNNSMDLNNTEEVHKKNENISNKNFDFVNDNRKEANIKLQDELYLKSNNFTDNFIDFRLSKVGKNEKGKIWNINNNNNLIDLNKTMNVKEKNLMSKESMEFKKEMNFINDNINVDYNEIINNEGRKINEENLKENYKVILRDNKGIQKFLLNIFFKIKFISCNINKKFMNLDLEIKKILDYIMSNSNLMKNMTNNLLNNKVNITNEKNSVNSISEFKDVWNKRNLIEIIKTMINNTENDEKCNEFRNIYLKNYKDNESYLLEVLDKINIVKCKINNKNQNIDNEIKIIVDFLKSDKNPYKNLNYNLNVNKKNNNNNIEKVKENNNINNIGNKSMENKLKLNKNESKEDNLPINNKYKLENQGINNVNRNDTFVENDNEISDFDWNINEFEEKCGYKLNESSDCEHENNRLRYHNKGKDRNYENEQIKENLNNNNISSDDIDKNLNFDEIHKEMIDKINKNNINSNKNQNNIIKKDNSVINEKERKNNKGLEKDKNDVKIKNKENNSINNKNNKKNENNLYNINNNENNNQINDEDKEKKILEEFKKFKIKEIISSGYIRSTSYHFIFNDDKELHNLNIIINELESRKEIVFGRGINLLNPNDELKKIYLFVQLKDVVKLYKSTFNFSRIFNMNVSADKVMDVLIGKGEIVYRKGDLKRKGGKRKEDIIGMDKEQRAKLSDYYKPSKKLGHKYDLETFRYIETCVQMERFYIKRDIDSDCLSKLTNICRKYNLKFNIVHYKYPFWLGISFDDAPIIIYDNFDPYMVPLPIFKIFISSSKNWLNIKNGAVLKNYSKIFILSDLAPEIIYEDEDGFIFKERFKIIDYNEIILDKKDLEIELGFKQNEN